MLWFPDHGVLHSADVIQGECLPNLYALRGAVRDIGQWIGTVDLLRTFDAQALLFGHGRPLTGRDEVRDLLTSYRDAMHYLHDQTIRLIARGLTPDELVEVLAELPPRLRDHPWLGQFYGTVKQTVRQIYSNTFGWFEGDPTFLDPLPRRERAARYIAAMGGRDAVIATAEQAHADRDYRWTAEVLTTSCASTPTTTTPANSRQIPAPARLPGAQPHLAQQLPDGRQGTRRHAGSPRPPRHHPRPRQPRRRRDHADPAPPPRLHHPTQSRPQRRNLPQLAFQATDTDTTYSLAIRSEIAEILTTAPPALTLAIQTTEPTLRALLTGRLPGPAPSRTTPPPSPPAPPPPPPSSGPSSIPHPPTSHPSPSANPRPHPNTTPTHPQAPSRISSGASRSPETSSPGALRTPSRSKNYHPLSF
ncbi:MAG: alkyl sulfatase dimerization domain-containing protein [Thermomicrobiales bacterium]